MSFRLDTLPAERPEHADQEVATVVGRLVARALAVADRHDVADIAVLLCDAHQIAARLPVFDTPLLDAIAAELPNVSIPHPAHSSTNPKEPITMTTDAAPTYAELLDEVRTLRGLLADRFTAVENRLDTLEAWRRKPVVDTLRAREIVVRDIAGTATGRLYAAGGAAGLALNSGRSEIELEATDDDLGPLEAGQVGPRVYVTAMPECAELSVNADPAEEGPGVSLQAEAPADGQFAPSAKVVVSSYGRGNFQVLGSAEGGERPADDE